MELTRTKVLLAFAVVLGVALLVLFVPSDAWAGPPLPQATDPGSLLRLIKQMKASVAAWEKGGQDAARGVFAALATLNIVWLGVELLSSQSGDIRGGLGKLARELMVTSVLYALIALGPRLAREIVEFLRVSADGIGGAAMEDQTWNALQAIVKASVGLLSSGEVGVLEVLWLGLCVVVVIVVVGITGAVMLMVEAATELIIGLGAIVLAGGGAIWTRFLVTNYLRFSFSAGLALYVMRFVQAFVIGNLAIWAKEATGASGTPLDLLSGLATASTTPVGDPETVFTLVLMVIIQLVLVISMPTVALMLASGGIGRMSEWAGIGAAQRLGGMGAQGLRQAASAMFGGGGAARSAAGAASGAGQGLLSVLGSAGGAVPPAASSASAGSAREQEIAGGARGDSPGAGGTLQESGGSAAPIGADAAGDEQFGAGGAASELREGRASERGVPVESGASHGAGSGGPGGAASFGLGRDTARSATSNGAGSRSAWNGQGARAATTNSREQVSAGESVRPAGGTGFAESKSRREGTRQEGSAGISFGGYSAPSGEVGGGGRSRSEGGRVPSSPSRVPSAPGAATQEALGTSRGTSVAGVLSSPASPLDRPSSAPSGFSVPTAGQRSVVSENSVVPGGATAAGARGRGPHGQPHSAHRAASAGPSARGVSGKRGEHG